MIPVRLEVKNFIAYRSPDPLRFEGIHLACLTGANGAGKSSLLDAITWALWGRARAKRDDDLVHMGQTDMHVQLDFEQEGTFYRVIRRRTRRNRGTSTLDLFALLDGQPNTLSEPSIKETQNKINRLLRLDYETFVHSAFLQQGKADAFTTKMPAQRKQILSDILGLDQWAVYEDAAKEYLRAIDNTLQVTEVQLREIEFELAKEPRLREILAEARAAQQEAQVALTAAETRLAEVEGSSVKQENAQQNLAEIERYKREQERNLEEISKEIIRLEKRIEEFQATIQSQQEIEAGYAALQSAREADSTLGGKLLELTSFDQQRYELENRLRDARAELENEAAGYEARIVELERALELADPDELSVVQAEVLTLQTVENSRAEADDQVHALDAERAELKGRLDIEKAEGQAVRDRLERLRATTDPLCPLCGQPLDENHRAQLIEELDADLTARRTDWTATQDRIKAIGLERDSFRLQVSTFDGELKRMTPLLERAGVLQAQIDAADSARARLAEDQTRLDIVRVMLDGETYAEEIREQLRLLDEQRASVGYDRSTHDSARQQLDQYREYEVRQKALELALNALPDLGVALEGTRLRREKTHNAIADDARKIDAQKLEIERLNLLVEEEKHRREEVNRLRVFERTQYQRLLNAQQEIDALDKQRIRKSDLETRREQKRHEKVLYEELRAAFGKNGVPAMMIEAVIPELEAGANRLLNRMTDGRMSVIFSTQKEKASGEGVIETLDIQIADELGTRSYELYSGGEAFRVDFAIRVALSQLLARRAGAHLRTLFIDEGFGTQDEDGRNKLVEAITAIQEDFDLILVITHIDDLRDSFPVHVVVEKTPSGSRMTVR